MADATVRFLSDLVSINSVNPSLVPGAPGEAAVAEAIAAEMRLIGLDVVLQEAAPGRPNVVGVLDGARRGRTLMFCGHMDTVGVTGMAAPFEPVVRDGRLYGRGAQDMKGGVAAMVGAARGIVAGGGLASGRLIIAAVSDEEHASVGADALVTEWTADGAVVTEPTSLDIAIAHKGFAWLEISVFGRAAHGSRPAEGIDAILRMGRVLTHLEALDRALQSRTPHPMLGAASLHASTIAGGHELSSYPDRAVLQMERRTLPGESDEAPLAEVEAVLADLVRGDPSFKANARLTFARRGYELPATAAVAQLLVESIRDSGRSPTIGGASFWTDAAILAHAGIPSVLFGPGGAGLHSDEEYVLLDDVGACRDVLVRLAHSFC